MLEAIYEENDVATLRSVLFYLTLFARPKE
jgi:hypothetical protein